MEKAATDELTYDYYWYFRHPPERHGQPCRFVDWRRKSVSGIDSIVLVEFEDGERVEAPRNAIRKVRENVQQR